MQKSAGSNPQHLPQTPRERKHIPLAPVVPPATVPATSLLRTPPLLSFPSIPHDVTKATQRKLRGRHCNSQQTNQRQKTIIRRLHHHSRPHFRHCQCKQTAQRKRHALPHRAAAYARAKPSAPPAPHSNSPTATTGHEADAIRALHGLGAFVVTVSHLLETVIIAEAFAVVLAGAHVVAAVVMDSIAVAV